MAKLQRQIRSRYKALCASLGVRPTLRAGAGSAHEDAGEPNPNATHDVWSFESNVKRPTMQGPLSF